jgi:hypothetical protein
MLPKEGCANCQNLFKEVDRLSKKKKPTVKYSLMMCFRDEDGGGQKSIAFGFIKGSDEEGLLVERVYPTPRTKIKLASTNVMAYSELFDYIGKLERAAKSAKVFLSVIEDDAGNAGMALQSALRSCKV